MSEDDEATDHVLQFSDVAWPVVACKKFKGALVDSDWLFDTCLWSALLHEVLGQQRNVYSSLPESWHLDLKRGDPVVEVSTELSGAYHVVQVSIRGSYQADINFDWFRGSYSDYLFFL